MLEFSTSDRVHWDTDRLGVTFVAYDSGKVITCHVSRAAIDDNLDYTTPGTILDKARAQFEELTEQVRARVAARAFEADGSIRIKTGDWR